MGNISNIQNQSRHFMGRDDEIAEIRSKLLSSQGRVAVTALYGLRGVGKTTLAFNYAMRHAADYAATWQIGAQDAESMERGLIGLGVKLGWMIEGEKSKATIEELKNCFRNESRKILLIYDNAVSAESVSGYLPPGGAADVIITSNAQDWGKVAATVPVDVWSDEVGGNYLVERLGRRKERAEAEGLSKALGGLPLALEQAATYCAQTKMSLSEFKSRFDDKMRSFLSDERYIDIDYHSEEARNYRTVAGTFGFVIQLASDVPGAEPLMVYAALLAEDNIPVFIFEREGGKLGEPLSLLSHAGEIDNIIAKLLSFSLIYVDYIKDERYPAQETRCIRLHRLVREIAATRRSPDQQREMKRALLAALAAIYPKEVFIASNEWLRVRRLNIHARLLVDEVARSASRGSDDEVSLLNLLAEYQHGALGNYTEALALYSRALETAEAMPDPVDPVIGVVAHGMGWLLATMGKYDAALKVSLKALAVRKKALGKHHIDTGETFHRVGWICVYQARYKRAKAFLDRACVVYEGSYVQKASSRSGPYGTLAWLYASVGRYKDACEYYERDKNELGAVHGTESPVLATPINNLGIAYMNMGLLQEAKASLGLALKMRFKELGAQHSETATTFYSIGMLRMLEKRFDRAETLYRRALRVWRTRLGPRHPRYARVLASMAELKLLQKKLVLAERLALRALSIREHAQPQHHPDLAHSQLILARILLARDGDQANARLLLQQAIDILASTVTEEHVWLRATRETLQAMEA